MSKQIKNGENLNKTEGATANHKKKKKPNTRKVTHSKFLWFALVVALVPFLYLGYLLIDASLQTGTPIHGDRYANDLDPAITEAQLSQIESSVKGATGVEGLELYLDSATVRLLVDVKDDMSVADAKKLGSSLIATIYETLPKDPYFTKSGIKKMYDIEVYLTDVKVTSSITPTMIVLAHKSSGMESASVDVLSAPKNQEYVDGLREKEAKDAEAANTTAPLEDPQTVE